MEEGSRSIILSVVGIGILVLFYAVVNSAKIAILALNKNRVSHLANEGSSKASRLIKLLNEPSLFISSLDIVGHLAAYGASILTTLTFYQSFVDKFQSIDIAWIQKSSGTVVFVVMVVILTLITLVIGEILPKPFALLNGEKFALFMTTPMYWLYQWTKPLAVVLNWSNRWAIRLVEEDIDFAEEKITEEEIRMMIDVGEEKGVLNEIEKDMIDGIFEFDNTLAREVMTPRTNVFALNIRMDLQELIEQVVEEQYSRIPIYDEEIDNIVGILYLKDLFKFITKNDTEKLTLSNLLKKPYFVPDTKNIDELFKELKQSKNHMAILIDEYGGLSGILTIEDLLEEIVGNIADEHDEDTKEIEMVEKDLYLINGLISISDINTELDIDLPTDQSETIGGFVTSLIGYIPSEEDIVVQYEDFLFTVDKIHEKRIDRVKLQRIEIQNNEE